MPHSNPALDNGVAVIHANKLEQLRDVAEYWLQQHPLAPLENEVFLVQSNGMGQWLKQSLAQNSSLGIAAAMSMQLPSMFVWSAYRAVLGEAIPEHQALAKAPLLWRLYRLLPALTARPGFEALAVFLADDRNRRKRHQLAEQLADIFDQYQVYRSDWLADWVEGRDGLRDARGDMQPLPETQRWQAELWRALTADLGDEAAACASRAEVHRRFMAHVGSLEQRPAGMPRRIMLFGLSSLPQQSLEVLAKLGKFCQIVLFVQNPCRHYWADIIEDKELLQAERRRQSYKKGTAALSAEELHLHAPPLLAAWGKQGRDYIRLLDRFDETRSYADWHWPENKIDVFDDFGEAGRRSLLQRLQQNILDLEPLPEEPETLRDADDSLAFHVAHSPQREVEILHDQLLASFEQAQRQGYPLSPRDVVVMVPDINQYAPHIRAVFGVIGADDPRYIPFSLADQQQRGQNPLMTAVETLLNLPESRFQVSELLGLLEVPALRARFHIDESAVPKLHQWIEQSGIRWGLTAEHRAHTVAMPAHLEANTWRFGLRRMLLGYAVGAGESFDDIEPYEEIGGLEAQWLGGLSLLLETLEYYAGALSRERCADAWLPLLSSLLIDFFRADGERDRKTLDALTASLQKWGLECRLAGMSDRETLPVNVVREAWLGGVDEPALHRRFLSGRVNFCTLMPMRAIPFRLICILGMNDGDYPRNRQAPAFDLMSRRGHYRPGDRSRRQDDQYLFLEALLSARRQLYISWVGRNVRDNSEQPPSVLISQLREVVSRSWSLGGGRDLLKALTVEHPLQPFSRHYVENRRDPRLFTYAREWYEDSAGDEPADSAAGAGETENYTLTPDALARFLKAPVKTFCNLALKFGFEQETAVSEDAEPFGFDALEAYVHSETMLQELIYENPENDENFFNRRQTAMTARGQLPLAGFGAAGFETVSTPVQSTWRRYRTLIASWPHACEPHVLRLPAFALANGKQVLLTGGLGHVRASENGRYALVYAGAQSLIQSDKALRHHNLLGHWVRHLAACADGLPVWTLAAAADTGIEIEPIEPAEAIALLQILIEAYDLGIESPLPVAVRSAFALLLAPSPEQAESKARLKYEGNDSIGGEVAYDAYLARFFPSFDDLKGGGGDNDFAFWAERLYGPAVAHIKSYDLEPGASS
ncbi:MAG: exodeoxyribonuclease V subunit gamma [Gammaproteobacteria bacterium]